jgi:hypothetical protein
MIDTVKIKHFYQSLISEDFKTNFKHIKFGNKPTWILNDKDARVPNLTMILTPNGIWHFSAEASLPKMQYGHNAKLLTQDQIDSQLDLMCKYAELHSGLKFDVETATVANVHFAKDFYLSESKVWQMIKKLSAKNLPRMDKLFYNDTTIYFKAKTRSIRIYPKLQEVLARNNPHPEAIKSAKGILRIEHCLTSNYAINSLVKKFVLSDKTPNSILNEDVLNSSMSEVLESLNFYELQDLERTNTAILLELFPILKAMKLLGFLKIVDDFGEDFYKDKSHGFNKRSYLRYLRDCRKAKVWKLE